jgi:hypothetical protein
MSSRCFETRDAIGGKAVDFVLQENNTTHSVNGLESGAIDIAFLRSGFEVPNDLGSGWSRFNWNTPQAKSASEVAGIHQAQHSNRSRTSQVWPQRVRVSLRLAAGPLLRGREPRMALAYAKGKLALNEPLVRESVLGTRFLTALSLSKPPTRWTATHEGPPWLAS